MDMVTNLDGRLRNTALPLNQGLLPMFDAVINSIHAIEEAQLSTEAGRITVEIMRDPQQLLGDISNPKKRGPDACKDIIGFKIIDNGIGFTDANMESFLTLDSDYKADKGCRGVGRLLWLKAFKRVYINSTYIDNDDCPKVRSFLFSSKKGVAEEKCFEAPAEAKRNTTIHLDGYGKNYHKSSRKTIKAIAHSLFEHCLWHFVRTGSAPEIVVTDGDERFDLNDIYDQAMVSSAQSEQVKIKGYDFELTHIKLRANSTHSHSVAYCAAQRLVIEESITGKIPGLYGKLHDKGGEFVYECYVTSPFLDLTVRPERTGFNIIEKAKPLLAATEISLNDIKDVVINKASEHLSGYLEENKQAARTRLNNFVSGKAPRYRPILGHIPEGKLNIDPNISDKDLDLTLHKHLAEIEEKLLAEGHNIASPKPEENYEDYKARINEYLQKAEDIKKSDLANYVSHRRVILDLLENAIKKDSDGKYVREDLIHNLIMPMRSDSNEAAPESNNLWLINERLAFHDYLASDKPLSTMPITDSKENKKPDILAFNVHENPILVSEGEKLPLASIVVVEIKRPMRNDATKGEDKDPVEQALGYLERIRHGLVQTASGRQIPESDNIPGYCYAICDITPSIRKRCGLSNLTPTPDKMGYFGYNATYKAYIEVISYDLLLNAAKERNRAFFDKLGLPAS